ncbi:MAG: DNA-processing protein DprA [Actinomycetia bacterium]|nr:DNA-processing protein DprA [Actinomycetes bacterium]
MSTKKDWLSLKVNSHISKRINRCLRFFGSPENILKANFKEWVNGFGLKADTATDLLNLKENIDIEREFKRLKELNIDLLTIDDEEYPQNLTEIYMPPPVFFYKGDLIKKYNIGIGIVGSRRAGFQSLTLAKEIADDISKAGVTVISGLARGVDKYAHIGALNGSGNTIGVIGNGLNIIYPSENRSLYLKISEAGSLISEFCLDMKPYKQNFPQRNRIISGLSRAVLVVEASKKSGALITAHYALEQNRDLMAVPGNVRNSKSKGTNKLIKEGAFLIESADDIFEVLGIEVNAEMKNPEITDKQKKILDYIEAEPTFIDNIIRNFNGDQANILYELTIMEMNGLIQKIPGNQYIKLI